MLVTVIVTFSPELLFVLTICSSIPCGKSAGRRPYICFRPELAANMLPTLSR